MSPDPIDETAVAELICRGLADTIVMVHGRVRRDKVALALSCFLTRVANTWRSIQTLWGNLRDDFPDTFMVDAGALVRTMFDAYIQAAYLLQDLTKREERARLYLEHQHIEKRKVMTKIMAHDSPLSQMLRRSPRRPKGEKALQQNYDRVKANYPRPKKRGVRDRWHEGNLRDLAIAICREAEHDQYVSTFHGCVHSSALAVLDGPLLLTPEYVAGCAAHIASMLAKLCLDHYHAQLEPVLQAVIDAYASGTLAEMDADLGAS